MINSSDRITPRAIAPNALYTAGAAGHPNWHAGLAMMHRSLGADAFDGPLPSNAHTLPHGQAAQAVLGKAKNSLPASAAQVHAAQVQKSASTPVDTAALARDINAAVKAGGGSETSKSLNVSVPSTQTPLQRLLLKAVNGLPPAVLAVRPALLAAVQAGFQTQGGRQLALAAGIYDASLVGDLSQPVAAAGSATRGRRLAETDLYADAFRLVYSTLTFDSSIPLEKQMSILSMLTSIAETSPTFRNTLTVAGANVKSPIKIVFNPELRHPAAIQTTVDGSASTIYLESINDLEETASNIVFETGNASIQPEYRAQTELSRASYSELPPQPENSPESVLNLATQIYQGGLRKDSDNMAEYVRLRLDQPDIGSKIDAFASNLEARFPIDSKDYNDSYEEFFDKLVKDIEKEGRTDFAAVKKLVIKTYTPRSLYLAITGTMNTETTEELAVKAHHAVFGEIDTARKNGKLPAGTEHLFAPESIQNMDFFRSDVTMSVEEMKAHAVKTGHAFMYFKQEMEALENAGYEIYLSREPTDLAGLSLEEAGTSAGQAVRRTINRVISSNTVAATDGVVQAAVKASLKEQCFALAQKMANSPEMAAFLKTTGKVVTPLVIAGMTVELGRALETDVKNGDRGGHAFLSKLAGLSGGWAGGIVGAQGGAIAGALVGSEIPGIGNAIGAFVGGLFGGMLGWAATDAATTFLFDQARKPLDSLISGVIDNQRFNAIVDARLKVTHDKAASDSYAQTATRLGMTQASAVHFAGTLSPAEGASDRFMTDLAGRLNATKQDWQGSVKFARDVQFFGIPAAGATYASDRMSAGHMQAMFDSRLKATGDIKASLLYAKTAFNAGVSQSAAVHFASTLTLAEVGNTRFMMDLAGRMNSIKQGNNPDLHGALVFARAVQFFGIPATNPATQVFSILGPNATYDSDSAAAASMQAVFDARLKTLESLPSASLALNKSDEDISASLRYTQTASNLGMTQAAAVRFASALTPAEGVDDGLMTDLAGRLVATNQDFAASMEFILARRKDIANDYLPSSGDENMTSAGTRQAVYEYGSKGHFSDAPGGDQLYAANVAASGMNAVAGIYFANILTTGEATSYQFLTKLAARLANTHQDLQGSLDYVRSVM